MIPDAPMTDQQQEIEAAQDQTRAKLHVTLCDIHFRLELLRFCFDSFFDWCLSLVRLEGDMLAGCGELAFLLWAGLGDRLRVLGLEERCLLGLSGDGVWDLLLLGLSGDRESDRRLVLAGEFRLVLAGD